MNKTRLWTGLLLAVVLIVIGALAAGCGGTDETTSTTVGATTTTAAPAETTTTAAPAETTTTVASTETTAAMDDLGGYTGPDLEYIEAYQSFVPPTSQPGETFKVGYMSPFTGVNVLLALSTSMEARLDELGGVEYTMMDGGLDVQKQIGQMSTLLSLGMDIITAYPVVDVGLEQSVADASKEIPIILQNTPANTTTAPNPNATMTIGLAHDLASWANMKYIAEQLPGASVAFLRYGGPSESLTWIMDTAKSYATEFGLEVLGDVEAKDASVEAATTAAQGLLGKYPDVDVIVAYNDYAMMAAVTALKTAGQTGVVCSTPNGADAIAIPAIKDGSVICTYRNNWEGVGTACGDASYAILTNQGSPLPTRMVVPGVLATKDNVDTIEFVQ